MSNTLHFKKLSEPELYLFIYFLLKFWLHWVLKWRVLDIECDYFKKMPTLGKKKNYNEVSPHTGQNGHR